MTKEEASNILDDYDVNFEGHTAEEIAKAFDVASRALEQEPCDNAIDRSKAIMIASGYCHPANVAKELAKLPPVNPQPCEDAISRQAVQDYIAKYLSQYLYNDVREAVEVIDEYIGELPSVNPQPKTGEWNTFELFQSGIKETWYECPKCKWSNALLIPRNYCPNCGAKMVEPQEREG